jgi:hypothetical protein
MKPTLIVASALLVAVAAAPAAAQTDAVAPSLRVEHERIELGEIKAGSEAVATFVFHNDSDQDVNIIRAKPS